jgi:hypothetical protein
MFLAMEAAVAKLGDALPWLARAQRQMIQAPDYRFDKRFRSSITSTEWREVSTLV